MSAELRQAREAVDGLAEWSEWMPFVAGAQLAPKLPGVYMIRLSGGRQIVYVGKAEERAGTRGDRPKGLWGRLAIYRGGKGATSGFGEAAFDRALASIEFVQERLRHVMNGEAETAKEWAKAAIAFAEPELRWAVCVDGKTADRLEREVFVVLERHGLWNKGSLKVDS